MRRKSKLRVIKSINVAFAPSVTVETIENIPSLKDIIYEELYSAVQDASNKSKNTTVLFELNDSGYTIELKDSNWIIALRKAISYYEKTEKYEKCRLYQTLIDNINEQRSKQSDPSNKQYTKRRNTSKKKEKNPSSKK